jgi:hypothetical protein
MLKVYREEKDSPSSSYKFKGFEMGVMRRLRWWIVYKLRKSTLISFAETANNDLSTTPRRKKG